ncbi:MAG: DNA translocase FtsK 4TM domain-containing protein [Chlamydiales bacterium]|nr:DNA translocase FtsK 4TM domain-containing protein [Chlamydiales bacterium]
MGKSADSEKAAPPSSKHPEATGLGWMALSLVMLLSLLSFRIDASASNWLGLIGWGLSFALYWTFGLCSYLLAFFLGWLGWQNLLDRKIPSFSLKIFYFSLFILSLSLLLNLCSEKGILPIDFLYNRIYSESLFFDLPYPRQTTRSNLGGVPLYYLYRDLPTFNLQTMLSDVGITLTSSLVAIASFILLTGIRIVPLLLQIKNKAIASSSWILQKLESPEKEAPQDLSLKTAQEIETILRGFFHFSASPPISSQ